MWKLPEFFIWKSSFFGGKVLSNFEQACFLNHADNDDSYQTARMRRLILVFVGRTCQHVCFLTLRLKSNRCKQERTRMWLCELCRHGDIHKKMTDKSKIIQFVNGRRHILEEAFLLIHFITLTRDLMYVCPFDGPWKIGFSLALYSKDVNWKCNKLNSVFTTVTIYPKL